jgi:hypothetical protein
MKFLRGLILPLLAAVLVFTVAGLYSVPTVTAHKERSAQSKKPAQFHYVCPMHEDITSKKPGKCPKCKMKLEKKQIKEPVAQPSDQ